MLPRCHGNCNSTSCGIEEELRHRASKHDKQIRPSLCSSVRPSTYRSYIRPSLCLYVRLSGCSSVRRLSVRTAVFESVPTCFRIWPVFVSVCVPVCPSVLLYSVRLYLYVRLSFRPFFIYLYFRMYVCPLVHLFIRLSVCGAEPVGVFLPVCVPAYSAYVCLCLRSDWLWSSYCTTSYVLLRFFYLYCCLYDFVFVLESASLCACVSMYVSIRSNVCPYCREKLFSC